MSVAMMSRVPDSISTMPVRRRRALALAGAAVTAGLLVVAVTTAGMTGFAFALALIAVTVAAILWVRLRDAERRNAALTAELAVLVVAAGSGGASGSTEGTDVVPETTPAPVVDLHPQITVEPDDTAAMATGPVEGDADALVADDDERSDVIVADASILERLPSFSLPALSGAKVWDTDLAGRASVMVFWRPGCGHCQRLTPELAAWESLQGPRLIVVAACDGPTAYRSGLPGLVLLDPGFTVGQALGAPGTPAALPLGQDGQPSGPVVAGTTAVMTLLLDEMRAWGGADVASGESESDVPSSAPDSSVDLVMADGDGQRASPEEAVEASDVPATTDADGVEDEMAEVEMAAVAVAAEDAVTADAGEEPVAGREEPVAGAVSDPIVAEGAVSATPTSEPESIEAVVALRRVGSFAAGSDQDGDADDAPVRRAG